MPTANFSWDALYMHLNGTYNTIKFNNSFDGTSNTTQFVLTRDTVTFSDFVGNNTDVNRSSTQTRFFSLKATDTNGSIVDPLNITFSITIDGSLFDSGFANQTDGGGFSNYTFDPTCTPSKYKIGHEILKVSIPSTDTKYNTLVVSDLNISVWGDIILNLTTPDGTDNFTQEEPIIFTASTVDDCYDALATNVSFYINRSGTTTACGTPSQLGANAYICNLVTDITYIKDYYNASFTANTSYHFTNFTANMRMPGLFFVDAVYKLQNNSVTPSTEGWGYPNWNFSVLASSGDQSPQNVSLYMQLNAPNPFNVCNATTCFNQTTTLCTAPSCLNQQMIWLRNFTFTEQGQWYYQFKMNNSASTSTSGFAFVTVDKDNANVTHVLGNNTVANITGAAARLIVRVFDIDADKFNLTTPAMVNFNISYTGIYNMLIGSNTTNATGYASFDFNATCSQGLTSGAQNWLAEINSTEPYYKQNRTSVLNVTVDLTGCQSQISVINVRTPSEAFENRNFTINATVTSLVGDTLNATVNITLPAAWVINNRSFFIGTLQANTVTSVLWYVNATGMGMYNASIFAYGSTGSNNTNYSFTSANFTVYKYYNETCPSSANNGTDVTARVCTADGTVGDAYDVIADEALLAPGQNLTAQFACPFGDYRVAEIVIRAEGRNDNNTKLRVTSYYNGTLEVLHSQSVGVNITDVRVPVLRQQLTMNESGVCAIVIGNVGGSDMFVDYVSLKSYYNVSMVIFDIDSQIDGSSVTGIESSSQFFNASIRVRI